MNADTSTPVIEGAGITKVFKDFWGRPKVRAVEDVDISVPKGGVFGLLGPNGAGKSTLIKMILGHLYPTRGRLTVFGRSPTDVKSKEALGYVPERAFLYKHLTPMQTLRFFGQVLELPSDIIEARSDQLLRMVGLLHAKDRIVGEFSHGMGRRMGLAQALLNDPDLLLLDEPTAGLDPLGCREVKNLIMQLSERGKTVLLTSHLLADVEEVCDNLMIMYGGKVQTVGPAKELLMQKDILQVTMPARSEDMKERIAAAVGDDVGKDEILFSSPIQSLEGYFLDVVRKASESQQTHGARAGAGVADYLKTPEGQGRAERPAPKSPPPAKPQAEGPEPESPLPAKPDVETFPVSSPKPEVVAQPKEAIKVEVEPAEETVKTVSPPQSATPVDDDWLKARRPEAPPQENDDDDDSDHEDIDYDLLNRLTK